MLRIYPSPAIFNNALDEQNFSIISNRDFITKCLGRIIETVRTKCVIGETLKVRGQKNDKLSLKIV